MTSHPVTFVQLSSWHRNSSLKPLASLESLEHTIQLRVAPIIQDGLRMGWSRGPRWVLESGLGREGWGAGFQTRMLGRRGG